MHNTMDSRFLALECNKVNCYDSNKSNDLLVIIFNTLEVVIVDLISVSIRCRFRLYEIYSIISSSITSSSNKSSLRDRKNNGSSREMYYRKKQALSLPLHLLKFENKKNTNPKIYNNSDSGNTLSLGEVHTVKFIDRKSMYEIFGESYANKITSDHMILIVCDNIILIYDYILRKGYTIPTEIGKSTTCAEFISHNLLSIGYHDGSITFMNIPSNQSPLKIYPSYSKSMISFMRLCSYQTIVHENTPFKVTHIFRLLVIQQDGAAYIWEGCISNNNVDIRKNQPSIQLKDGVRSNSFFSVPVHKLSSSLLVNYSYIDDLTTSLVTITSDRVVRMWDFSNIDSDLSNISTKISSRDSVSRNKRLSFFSSLLNRHINTPKSNFPAYIDAHDDTRERSNSNISSNSTSSERDRSNTNTTSDISTIITNKHTVQSFSDNSATRRADDNSVLDLMCYERIKYNKKDAYSKFSACAPIYSIKYPTGTYILANKVNSNLLIATSNVHESFSDRTSETNSNTLFLDPLHEINVLHLLQRYNITANHTIKVMLLRTIRKFPELILICTNVGILVLNIVTSISGPFVGTHKEWGPIHLSYSNSSIQKSKIMESSLNNKCENGDTSEFIYDTTRTKTKNVNIISTDMIEELNCQMSNVSSVKSSPIKSYSDYSNVANRYHDFIINRPIVLSSPSGNFCTFYWPQSCYYVIVAVNISWKSGACMQEVERGQCTHFAWLCDYSNFASKVNSDIFVILSVKNQSADTITERGKRVSLLNNLFSSDTSTTDSDKAESTKLFNTSASSADLMFKYFSSPDANGRYGISNQIIVSNITTEIKNISSINQMHGGLLLCLTTTSISSDFYNSASKSKLLHLIRDENGNQMLKKIGPSMAQVTQVSWDYSTGYGALCIGDRINIIYLQISENNCTLQCIHSIGMEAPRFNYSLWWDLGSLFICCSNRIYVACTQFPHSSRVRSTGYVGKRDINIPVVDIFNVSHKDLFLINPAIIENNRNLSYAYNPELQYPEVIDIRRGNLIISSPCNGTIFSLPLIENPLIALTMILSYGDVKVGVEWTNILPLKLHVSISNLLTSRGLKLESLFLKRISNAYFDEFWRYRDYNNETNFSDIINPKN